MKKFIQKITAPISKAWSDTSPKKRNIIVFVIMVIYAALTFYVLFTPTPDYRYEEYIREDTPATNLIIEDDVPATDSLSAEKIQEMEKFFNQFNTDSHE